MERGGGDQLALAVQQKHKNLKKGFTWQHIFKKRDGSGSLTAKNPDGAAARLPPRTKTVEFRLPLQRIMRPRQPPQLSLALLPTFEDDDNSLPSNSASKARSNEPLSRSATRAALGESFAQLVVLTSATMLNLSVKIAKWVGKNYSGVGC